MAYDFLKELEIIVNGEKEDFQENSMNIIMDDNSISLTEKLNLYFQPLIEVTESVEEEMTSYQKGLEVVLVRLIKSKKKITDEYQLKSIDEEILEEYNYLKQSLFYDYYEEFFPDMRQDELETKRITEEKQLLEILRKQKRVGMI